MSGKKKDTGKKVGFYAALAVCLVAVGVAAWSTFDAVQLYDANYDGAEDSSAPVAVIQPESSAVETAGKEDGEALIDSDRDKNTLSAAEKNAQETNATVASKPTEESEESSSAFIPQEQEFGVPVNAGTVYEVSTIMHFPVSSQEIISEYSSGVPVYSETMRDWRIHTGCDIKAESGEEVKACGNGIVKSVSADTRLGNIIVAEHGEYEFWYCGLDENIPVSEGDVISMGQKIGTITAVPFEAADETHLHLEVKRDGVTINPIEVLEKEITQ